MNRIQQLRFFIAMFFCLLATNAQAAVISVQPILAGYFDTNLIPLPPLASLPAGVPVVVQVDIFAEVLSLAPGEDSFGFVAFWLKGDPLPGSAGRAVPDLDAGGWAANNPNVDTNGPAPGGIQPLFAVNADVGPNNQDYRGVLIQIGTGRSALTNPDDPRRDVGEVGSSLDVPFLLGSAFFEWNRLGDVDLGFGILDVVAKRTDGLYIVGQAAPVTTIPLRLIPEPSSLVLAGCCFAGMGFRRRVN